MATEKLPGSTANPIASAPEERFDGIRRPYSAMAESTGTAQVQTSAKLQAAA